MILEIIALLIGVAIFGGGLYYLVHDKQDKEARRIYQVTVFAGIIIIAVTLIKIFL